MQKGQQTKLDIALKVKDLFATKGYSATSMEEICQTTGRSKGSIYYHFKSKEELFLFIFRTITEEWIQTWNEKEKYYRTTKEKLYALAEHHIDEFENPFMKAVEEFSGSQLATKDILEEALELSRQPYVVYERLIVEGMERGELKKKDARTIMYILYGLMTGLGITYYDMSIEEMKDVYKEGITVFLDGMST
ncbi:TetR/AcrR family transcriptional regulator [Priestia taiwanensis]|uniref:TetR family transcriptional regulator n=1 Tax=Priestia taiwanensis TaxID=1347902 RepID=A0A917AUY1_9BACI|nr:TetR/AcrR family transcriptional regulator [Priestia taiwanensis]MBM7363370.1 AcrR family transcriptional regulator [Priestia taiwanensis]GGE77718.1 TetR family transcriptional regulator [Priestia taiwanensis]